MTLSVTAIIVIGTVVVSLAALNDKALQYRLMFSPYRSSHMNEWTRVFTHAFVHADLFHLIFNMYVLWNFGELVENTFVQLYGTKGTYFYVLLYVGGIFFATIPAFTKHSNNDSYWSLGASGAVAAVLFSFILMYPDVPLMLMFIPVPIPAWIFGLGYLALEYFLDKRGGGRVAHDAHFWGALFGLGFTAATDFDLVLNFLSHFG